MNRFASAKFVVATFVICASIIPTVAQRREIPVDLIIRGGTVVTMDGSRRVIENGGIAIKDGRIVAVDPAAVMDLNYSSRQVVEAQGKVVIPGLINGHTHVPMTLFRGIADDLDLQEWLTKYIFPAEAKNVTEDFVRVGTRLGLAEMIRSGTTTYCDMYYFEDAIADETFKAGMRGVLGETVIDFRRLRAFTGKQALILTDKEFEILRYLAEHVGKIVSRDELLHLVWGYESTPVTRTVDNFIFRLRQKIEPDPRHPRFIQTVYGDGYRLTIPT